MIHLHVHTARGSLLDSTNTPKELVSRAKELNMKALAITDHGSMSNVIQFYKECIKQGVKPIIGIEAYVCKDMNVQDNDDRYDHLILLAKNNEGYKKLMEISSIGYLDGFYYRPRIDKELLKKYKGDIIACSACLGGTIPQMIMNKAPKQDVIKEIESFKELFDEFYLEVQPARQKDQLDVNKELALLSEETNTALVATSDIHFLNESDFDLHGTFIQIAKNRDNEFYKDCWFKTEEETIEGLSRSMDMIDAFTAVNNTRIIADQCNVTIELGNSYLPSFPLQSGHKTGDSYLKELVNKGFISRKINLKDNINEYIDRARREFEVITKKDYTEYFLIVADFLNKCRERGIFVGDGRGSGAGSLICYLIGITTVDPLPYDLSFERFLTMDRQELPDLDLDIQSSRRGEAIDILRDTYGRDNVASIGTFQGMQSKAIMDAVGKVMKIDSSIVKRFKEKLVEGETIDSSLNKEEHQEFVAQHKKYIDACIKLEGLPRSFGTHAGGVVIAPDGKHINDYSPLFLGKEKQVTTQFDMGDVELAGLVKIDALGLTTLDIIQDTLNMIPEKIDFSVENINFQDNKTWELIQSGNTAGIFQVESSGMVEACKEILPDNMEDYTALISLYRPATMKELSKYAKRKHGKEEVTYFHPDMEKVLGKTLGVLAYQEQIMNFGRIFAGFNDVEADMLRKGTAKKKKEVMDKILPMFSEGCKKNGYDQEVVDHILDLIAEASSYSFNKSHGVAYAVTSYKTAFLKAHYPIEFMCATLNNQKTPTGSIKFDKIGFYISRAKQSGIEINKPDINQSEYEFVIRDGKILYGLGYVKNVGKPTVEAIKKFRPFNSLEHFLEKMEDDQAINKTAMIYLIKSGAFDFLGVAKENLLLKFATYRFNKRKEKLKPIQNANKNHIDEMIFESHITPAQKSKMTKDELTDELNYFRKKKFDAEFKEAHMQGEEYNWEYEALSCSIMTDLFDDFHLPCLSDFEDGDNQAKVGGMITGTKTTKIKRGKMKGEEMAFVQLETSEGIIESVVFPDQWKKFKGMIETGNTIVIRGKKEEESKLIMNGAKSIDKYLEEVENESS